MPTIRFHIKVLQEPRIRVDSLVQDMRRTFGARGIGVAVSSVARITPPNAALFADVAVDCRAGGSSAEQRALFGDGQSNWSGWVGLGGPPGGFRGAPAALSRGDGLDNVYVRGSDNALWQLAWYGNTWHGWQRHNDGGVLASAPAVSSMNGDHEQVFVRGTDGAVWQKWWTQSGGWSRWVSHGAPPPGMNGGPATIARKGDVTNVYVRGNDNKLWQKAWFNSQWTGWMQHYDDGVLASEPSPDSMNPDHEHVFVRGTDNTLYQKWWFEPRRNDELVVFFVGAVTDVDGSVLNGCASFPGGRPGAVVASYGSRWTLAHEIGHVLGLPHIGGENFPACTTRSFTRLMTGCGTSGLTADPPTLSDGEASTVAGNRLVAR